MGTKRTVGHRECIICKKHKGASAFAIASPICRKCEDGTAGTLRAVQFIEFAAEFFEKPERTCWRCGKIRRAFGKIAPICRFCLYEEEVIVNDLIEQHKKGKNDGSRYNHG